MHAHSEEPTLVGPAGRCDTLPPDPRIGALLGNFRVVRKLGEGGMGVVYEAEHQQIGRRAAIKLLHHHLVTDAQYAKRFLNEARAVNIIRHRGLVEIFEYGQLPDGTLFFVMEFLEGETLRRRIARRGSAFPVPEAVGLMLQVARALAAAHEKGIIHRDLKPENLMLVPEPVNSGLDWVKILDFGIAKVHFSRLVGEASDSGRRGTPAGGRLSRRPRKESLRENPRRRSAFLGSRQRSGEEPGSASPSAAEPPLAPVAEHQRRSGRVGMLLLRSGRGSISRSSRLAIGGLVLLLSGAARAQVAEPSPAPASESSLLVACEQSVACKRHLDTATKLYEQGRYNAALEEYKAAYVLQPYPLILYNIARLHHKQEHLQEAISYYQRYLDSGQPEQAERARQLLAAAQGELKSKSQPAPAPRPLVPSVGVLNTPSQPVLRAPGVPVYKRWWFWTLLGVAAVGAGTAIGVGIYASGPDVSGLPARTASLAN